MREVIVYCAREPHQMLLNFVNMEEAVVYLPKKKVASDSMKKRQSQELKQNFSGNHHPFQIPSCFKCRDYSVTLPTKAAEIFLSDSVSVMQKAMWPFREPP